MALTDKLTAIGDAIRDKTGSTDLLTLDAMPTAISGITTGGGDLPEEAFAITGECNYRFAYNGWDWFINDYGNRITTNLSNVSNMFLNSNKLTKIPFSLNADTSKTSISMSALFKNCSNLTQLPKMYNFKPGNTDEMFSGCTNLREITEDVFVNWDWSYANNQTSGYNCNRSKQFMQCYSLRKIPMSFLENANPKNATTYTIYSSCFNSCRTLDEVVGLPFPHTVAWTSNALAGLVSSCHRLKRFTFMTQEDGTPYTMQWKTQTIDLSENVGQYTFSASTICDKWEQALLENASKSAEITNHNSGITTDKAIYTAETYALLKDDPDAYCLNSKADGGARYSRYNHDSAVETINSLPDTSAYLAEKGGTNTIKFLGASGSATDGGAISTLTEEEIAVATAKGWTVTLV